MYRWKGFDNDKEWWLEAIVYITKKNQYAIYLNYICRASLLLDKKKWKENGEYLLNPHATKLFVLESLEILPEEIPTDLVSRLREIETKTQQPIEYLDI